jgi:predicted ribosome quality control (RQC) complex YloA/Tae2 family protein
VGEDRQLALRFEGREGAFELVLSILGPRSNLYLLDAEGVLRGALRPLSETRRDLRLGEPWRSPEQGPPKEGDDRFAAHAGEALLDAIEAHYGPAEREAGARELTERLAKVVAKEQKRLERRAEKVAEDARAGEEAAEHHRHGELLKSVLSEVAPGAREVVARDFASGESVAIPLDPKLSAAANLERLFKRYHKAIARATAAGGQQAELEERRARLDALASEIERAATDSDALAALFARDDVKRLLARHAPPPPPEPTRERERKRVRGEVPARLLPKRYRASG